MHDRTPLLTAFVDLEDALFGWDCDDTWTRTDGFVEAALGRRARMRTKTDRYPAVPMGPDVLGRYARKSGERTYVKSAVRSFVARSSAAS